MVVWALLVLAFTGDPFAELQSALHLSEFQIRQLTALRAENARASQSEPALLTEEQRKRLDAISSVLNWPGAMAAAGTGIFSCGQWPGACACFYPIRDDPFGLGLSEDQILRFEKLRKKHVLWLADLQHRRNEIEARIAAVRSADPLAAQALQRDADDLQRQADDVGAPRKAAHEILDEGQRAKLAVFESNLELVNQAIRLGLVAPPPRGEVLCH